ncbi:hypothetical protein ACJRO7_021174 [Eucalyptus globulus]|uniref:Uncharacterized protein n=1 Tax=Eucalyptus globulus TaxID=34317 RepID=A0ABD3KJN9_EUCGL
MGMKLACGKGRGVLLESTPRVLDRVGLGGSKRQRSGIIASSRATGIEGIATGWGDTSVSGEGTACKENESENRSKSVQGRGRSSKRKIEKKAEAVKE